MYLLPVFVSFLFWVRVDLMKLWLPSMVIRRVVLVAVRGVLGRKGG